MFVSKKGNNHYFSSVIKTKQIMIITIKTHINSFNDIHSIDFNVADDHFFNFVLKHFNISIVCDSDIT